MPTPAQLDMLNSPHHQINVKRLQDAGFTTDNEITWYPPAQEVSMKNSPDISDKKKQINPTMKAIRDKVVNHIMGMSDKLVGQLHDMLFHPEQTLPMPGELGITVPKGFGLNEIAAARMKKQAGNTNRPIDWEALGRNPNDPHMLYDPYQEAVTNEQWKRLTNIIGKDDKPELKVIEGGNNELLNNPEIKGIMERNPGLDLATAKEVYDLTKDKE